MQEAILVQQLPPWKQPCPSCNAKYPKPAVTHRKDGSGAWCKSCGTNWKIGTPLEAPNSPVSASGFERAISSKQTLEQRVEVLIHEVQVLIDLIRDRGF